MKKISFLFPFLSLYISLLFDLFIIFCLAAFAIFTFAYFNFAERSSREYRALAQYNIAVYFNFVTDQILFEPTYVADVSLLIKLQFSKIDFNNCDLFSLK